MFGICSCDWCREAMVSSLCEVIYLTEVETEVECDTYMPAVDGNIFRIWAASSPMVENGLRFSFLTYIRGLPNSSQTKPEETRSDIVESLPKFVLESHDEYQYLHMIEDIINTGNVKGDRTGTGTISKFGCQVWSYSFSHSDHFKVPIRTTFFFSSSPFLS